MVSNFVTQAFNVMGTILIIFVMIVVNADVIGRELFLSPIAGVPMMVSMSIVAIVFLQTPQTFRQGRLTQNEAILNSIGNRNRFIKLLIEVIYAAAAFYLVLQIFQATYPMFFKSWMSQKLVVDGLRPDFSVLDRGFSENRVSIASSEF